MGTSIVRDQDAKRGQEFASGMISLELPSRGHDNRFQVFEGTTTWMRIDLFFKAHEPLDSLMRTFGSI